tara:strand:+ start:302 stop:520 length:219 start_codon:yes stop_codon:yes gene_type:complete
MNNLSEKAHFSFAFPMLRARRSTSLYNLPIQTSSFGVGVDAAIRLATVTIIVRMLIIVKILLIDAPYEFAAT